MSRKFERQFVDPRGIYIEDGIGRGVFAGGTTVPTDGTAGYLPGCIFLDQDGAAGAQFYINRGSLTSCSFKPLDLGGLDLSTLVTTATELNLLSGLLATAAELNRSSKLSTREIAAGGANLTVTLAAHDGKTILLDQATGTAVTLPAMTGSGARYRFVCTVATSGGSQVITATAAHLFGTLTLNDDTGVGTLFTERAATSAGGSTTITLDGSTKGGRKGDWLEIEDVATSIGIVRGHLNASGTEATPFS